MGTIKIHQYLLKAITIWLLVLMHSSPAYAQVTSINGIINNYYSVIEVVPSKNCVRVSNPAGLSSVEKVMLIQMKGAGINTSNVNSSTWGDTTSLNEAGNYEIAYICAVVGDSAFLVHSILNSYNTASGKVQLVTITEYQNATVTDTIKAKSWDSNSGTGGVIVIDVVDTLVLNAPVYADSCGFRGGAFLVDASSVCNFLNPAGTAYAYDAVAGNNETGAYKGEGVAAFSSSTDGGKGAAANGGGGGNNHNNSGGGGANLAAGGRGGGNSSSGPLGCNISNNMGGAGKALGSWNGKKIFMGGGGGAGHNNNAVFTLGGGNGGGIIFIHADTVIGNGYKITAGGGAGGQSQGDGAGGGGGAGTIIMDVNKYLGACTIQANGGNGGNSNDVNTPSRCFGGGGAGSGGVIYFKGALPAITYTVNGGTAGTEINRDAGCSAAVPALAGTAGQTVINYTYRASSVLAGYCGTILPTHLLNFSAERSNKIVRLSWRINTSSTVRDFIVERAGTDQQWSYVKELFASDQQEIYELIDERPLKGANFYRIRINEQNGAFFYSQTRLVVNSDKELFFVYPNPATDKITVLGNYEPGTQLHLYSLSGKLLLRQKISTTSPNVILPALQKGIYVLRLNETSLKLIIH